MSRLIQMGDFFLDQVFDLVVSCCERVVVDEDSAVGGDGFDNGFDAANTFAANKAATTSMLGLS